MGVLFKGTKHIVRKLVYKSSTMILTLIITLVSSSLINSDKVVVEYLGEDYLVTGGCPSTDPTVLRWHKFCSFLHGNDTLCVTQRFGKNILTVYKLCPASRAHAIFPVGRHGCTTYDWV